MSELSLKSQKELAFWEDYAQDQKKVEAIKANNLRFYDPLFKGYKRTLKKATICEVGLGPLPYLSTLKCEKAIGIDPLMDEYLDLSRHQLEGIELHNWELPSLEIGRLQGMINAVLLLNVLDHVMKPDPVLFCCTQLLMDKGLFFIFVDLREPNQVDDVHPISISGEWLAAWLNDFNTHRVYGTIEVLRADLVAGREEGLIAYAGIWKLINGKV